MRAKPYRKYPWILGAVLGLGLGLVAAAAWWVDPFAIYGAHAPGDRLYGIGPYTRIAKPYLAAGLSPRIVIAGSSRAEYAADPKVAEKWLGLRPAFNIALSSANAYELRRNVEHVIALAPVEVQILGLDFYMFNVHLPDQANFSDARLAVAPDGAPDLFYRFADLGPTLLSVDAADAVRRALKYRHGAGECTDYWRPDGLLIGKDADCRTATQEGRLQSFRVMLEAYLTRHELYRGFELAGGTNPEKAHNGLANIERLLRLGQEKHQRVILYISPVHALQLEAIAQTGLWTEFERWKSDLTMMVARFAAQGLDVTLWDFADINTITSEALITAPAGEPMQSFYDSHHVRPAVGRVMLERMLSTAAQKNIPEDFGVRLTPDMLASHLAATRARRAVWRKSHPRDRAFFEAIAQSAGPAAKKSASPQ